MTQVITELHLHSFIKDSTFIPAATTNVVLVEHDNPPERPNLDWKDYVFRYDPDNKVLRVYFLKTPKDVPVTRTQLVPGVVACKDAEGKMRYFEFEESRLSPHMFDSPSIINGRPPLALSHHFGPHEDIFEISMVSEEWQRSVGCAGQFWNELDPTEMIIFDVDGRKRIMGFSILAASRLIAKKMM